MSGRDADLEAEAGIKLEGCVESELELEGDNAILPLATRGCTKTTELPESWGRGCGWNSETDKLTFLLFCIAPACGCCRPPSLSPPSLTQVPVDFLRLNRAHGMVSPVCPSLPILISLCASFLGWEWEGPNALCLGAQCRHSSLDHQAVPIYLYLGHAGSSQRAAATAQYASHEPGVLGAPSRGLRLSRVRATISSLPEAPLRSQVASTLALSLWSLQERENSSSGQMPPPALWGTCRSVCGRYMHVGLLRKRSKLSIPNSL